MFRESFSQLSAADLIVLNELLTDESSGTAAFKRLVRDKINHAIVSFTNELPDGVARIGSRVTYRVNGELQPTRILTGKPPEEAQQDHLSVQTVSGLALLGLAAGEATAVRVSEAGATLIYLEESECDPAVRRSIRNVIDLAPHVARQRARPPFFRDPSDDPGPSAA